MNSKILSRVEEKNKESALKVIKELEKRIKKGQLMVMTSGYWEGTNGKWNFNIVARESDNFRPFLDV